MKISHFMYMTLLCIFAAGCSNSGHRFVNVDDFKTFRDYTLITEDVRPQPAWSPSDYRIVVRSKSGVGILNEGAGNQRFYNTKDFSEVGWPTWVDNERIVVGSPTFMVKTDEGELTQSHVKLRLIEADNLVLEEKGLIGDVNAYYTRANPEGRVFAQKGESVVEIKLNGDWEEYDQGFFAEPQMNGDGVCLQTVPIVEKDHWTGKKGNGQLLVRWSTKHVELFDNCFQARWCADGGIIATRLNGNINDVNSWRELDSDIIYIAPGSKEIKVIKKHAHSPSANPVSPVVACVGRAGFLYLVDYKTGKSVELVPEGEAPQWSYDGRRLLTEVPGLDKTINLRVWVFRHQDEINQ